MGQASVDAREAAAEEFGSHLALVRVSPHPKDDSSNTWQTLGSSKQCMRTSIGVKNLHKILNGMIKFLSEYVPFAKTIKKVVQAIKAVANGKYAKALAITGDAIVHTVVDAFGGVVIKAVVKVTAEAGKPAVNAWENVEEAVDLAKTGVNLLANMDNTIRVSNTDPCI